MEHIISFFSYKGGAGRTSLLLNTLPLIAKELNASADEPIVVADLDIDSKGLSFLLDKYHLSVEEISDYHLYPIADNDTPQLSSDRLEYSLSNLFNYGFCTLDEVKAIYDDLCVASNEKGEPEICFKSRDVAEKFALCALEMSKIYVADADRLIMQLLADLIEKAILWSVLSEGDLYVDEVHVISKLMRDEKTAMMWTSFCQMKRWNLN